MSDTPKRYEVYDDGLDNVEIREALDGEWVSYEDYATLERKLTALRKEREGMIHRGPCEYCSNMWLDCSHDVAGGEG